MLKSRSALLALDALARDPAPPRAARPWPPRWRRSSRRRTRSTSCGCCPRCAPAGSAASPRWWPSWSGSSAAPAAAPHTAAASCRRTPAGGSCRGGGRSRLVRWQRRAENPMTAHEMAVAARVAVRSCEGILASLDGRHEAGSTLTQASGAWSSPPSTRRRRRRRLVRRRHAASSDLAGQVVGCGRGRLGERVFVGAGGRAPRSSAAVEAVVAVEVGEHVVPVRRSRSSTGSGSRLRASSAARAGSVRPSRP